MLFNLVVQGKEPRHIFGVRSGIIYLWSLSPYITQTQGRNTLLLGISMAEKGIDYKSWSLEDLRTEASNRSICFTSRDGVKALASKLRVHDKLMANPGDACTGGEEMEETETESNLTFEQQLQLQERELLMLKLRREMQMEEREAEREKREYERQRAREEEERLVREEERLRILRSEKEEVAVREAESLTSLGF